VALFNSSLSSIPFPWRTGIPKLHLSRQQIYRRHCLSCNQWNPTSTR